MRGRRCIGAALLALALALPVALAGEAFDVEVVTLKESILPGESALFEFSITNKLASPDRYTLASTEYSYILFLDPRPEEIAAGNTTVAGVEIAPRSFVNPGTHRVPIRVRSAETGEVVEVSPIIFVRDPSRTDATYTPSVALAVASPSEVDPRLDLTLNVHLRNRNARVYDAKADPLTVVIESDIFKRTYDVGLGPVGENGEKATEIRIDLDPYQPPGTHPLVVRLLVGNQTVSTSTTEFTILPYTAIEENPYEDGRFFKHATTYRLRNDGNVENVARIVYPIASIQRLFVTASHNYAIEEVDGRTALVIEEPLSPLGETTVTVTENYRLLVMLLALVVLSIGGYFLLRSPVVLGKEATLSGDPVDGISEIKVRLFVKNRSAKTMRALRVVDRVSGVAEIVKDDALGTLKPTRVVKKKGHGTLLRWDLDQLEPFEERIITYRVRMPLKLVGDVALPNMKVSYDLPSGRERTAHSNEVTISRRE